jgi:hypothetical protein
MRASTSVTVAVEGKHDEPVARRIIAHLGLETAAVYIAGGKAPLDAKLGGYNNAAKGAPWLVLRDFDHDAPCASALLTTKLPSPARLMRLRFPVRAVESWLLADTERISAFLSVAVGRVPELPDLEAHPKQTLVNLARRSRKRAIREDMVPAEGTSAIVGPGYTSRLIEYASTHWRPAIAARRSPSLARCIAALETLR